MVPKEVTDAEGFLSWHADCIRQRAAFSQPARASSSTTKGDIMKRLIALALAATFALPSFALLTGCNTVEGAGKDIQAGGAKIKNEAQENKTY